MLVHDDSHKNIKTLGDALPRWTLHGSTLHMWWIWTTTLLLNVILISKKKTTHTSFLIKLQKWKYPSPSRSKTLNASRMSSCSSFSFTWKVQLWSNHKFWVTYRPTKQHLSHKTTFVAQINICLIRIKRYNIPCPTSLWETPQSQCSHCHLHPPEEFEDSSPTRDLSQR